MKGIKSSFLKNSNSHNFLYISIKIICPGKLRIFLHNPKCVFNLRKIHMVNQKQSHAAQRTSAKCSRACNPRWKCSSQNQWVLPVNGHLDGPVGMTHALHGFLHLSGDVLSQGLEVFSWFQWVGKIKQGCYCR